MMSVKKQCEDTTVKNDNDNVKLNIKDAGDFESAETKVRTFWRYNCPRVL